MHHSTSGYSNSGGGGGGGPQERVHQVSRASGTPATSVDAKCPYESYHAPIPDCCAAAAAAAAQDPYPRPPSGYDTRCFEDCRIRTPYPDENTQVLFYYLFFPACTVFYCYIMIMNGQINFFLIIH